MILNQTEDWMKMIQQTEIENMNGMMKPAQHHKEKGETKATGERQPRQFFKF